MSPKKDESLGERVLRLELQRKQDRERDERRDKWLQEVHREIVGDVDSPGLRGRMERIETRQKVLAQVGGAIATFLGVAAAFVGLRK
jgi:hypothetical protein